MQELMGIMISLLIGCAVAYPIVKAVRRKKPVEITEEDARRLAFLRGRYVPQIESDRLLGKISEQEYAEEMRRLYDETERMENRFSR